MRKCLCLLCGMLLLMRTYASGQDKLSTENARISFFSSAPIEDISAYSEKGQATIDPKTGAVYFNVPVASFTFENSLMQSHFNADYLESDTYPEARFEGKITDSLPLDQAGSFPVTVAGTLHIHGVSRPYSGPATICLSADSLNAQTVFKVRLADYDIAIPRLLIKNIAEVVEVKASAGFSRK